MDLNIDFAAIKDVATQIGTLQEEFQGLLNDINSINSELKTAWEGDDASKYSTEIEEQAEYMRKLSQTIAEIKEFLVNVSNAYAKVSSDNMSIF